MSVDGIEARECCGNGLRETGREACRGTNTTPGDGRKTKNS
ncbi:hypothetical protein [Desulfobulbus propionicus]